MFLREIEKMQQKTDFENNVLILEGNIGSGKSTFLRLLKENLDVDVVYEPTDRWQSVGAGGNLLDLFYILSVNISFIKGPNMEPCRTP